MILLTSMTIPSNKLNPDDTNKACENLNLKISLSCISIIIKKMKSIVKIPNPKYPLVTEFAFETKFGANVDVSLISDVFTSKGVMLFKAVRLIAIF